MTHRLILIGLAFFLAFSIYAQDNSVNPEPIVTDPNMPQFKAGEILVKFRDDVTIEILKTAGTVLSDNPRIDQLSQKWQVGSMVKVFRNSGKMDLTGDIRLPDGATRQLQQLYNIYKSHSPNNTT